MTCPTHRLWLSACLLAAPVAAQAAPRIELPSPIAVSASEAPPPYGRQPDGRYVMTPDELAVCMAGHQVLSTRWSRYESEVALLDRHTARLDDLRTDLLRMGELAEAESQQQIDLYNEKADQINRLVGRWNLLLHKLQSVEKHLPKSLNRYQATCAGRTWLPQDEQAARTRSGAHVAQW